MANLSMWKVADPTTFLVSLWTVAMDKQTTKSPSCLASVSCLGSEHINTDRNAPALLQLTKTPYNGSSMQPREFL